MLYPAIGPHIMTIEKAIKQKRRRMRLSRRELAAEIGITGNKLAVFENGKQPIPIDILKKIIDILELDNGLYTIDG